MKINKLLFIAAVLALVVSPAVRAETSLTESQIDIIRTNCVNAQVNIQLIQENDRIARINRGYLYDSTLKLMTSLNSRIALNNLNAPDMISITSNFQKKLDEFRSNYNNYDDTMKELVTIDCRNRPVQYSDLLESARQNRAVLERRVVEFEEQLDSYQDNLNGIKQELKDEE